ncbi:MAG TPA: AMP-binding protein [Acidimicrobiia bacterium]|nr:AMP-binding protein [Acidimicrobiia bacterium]
MDLLHSLTLGDVAREHARSYPERTATVCGERRATFAQLDDRVNRLANAFLDRGVEHGDRVLWLGQNCHRILEGLLAAAKLGASFCPANWRQSSDEFAFILDDLDPRVVIWQEAEIGPAVREARAKTSSSAAWLQHDIDGPESYEAALSTAGSDDPGLGVDAGSAVLLMYTAAFEGTPNAAQLSHVAVTVQDLVMGMLQEITSDYVYLNCGPLFHIATFMTTMATFHFGGTNVFTPRVDAEELCRLINDERCTGAFVIGPTIDEILEVNSNGKYDLKSLRTFPGKPEWNEMITVDTSPWARKPAGYGQTECMGMLTFNAWGGDQAGSAGRPSPALQVKIVDPDGHEVPLGEPGEIVARGLTVQNGYYNRPEVNARRIVDGWWHTNDIGRRELDGSLSFVAPKGRLIKSAAENIYPAEVEQAINAHPAVKESAIIGVPDPKWHQSVKAIVVLADGQAASEDEIIEHVRSKIASYKKPRSVEFVDELPRQGWSIDYDALDERFGGGNYPTGFGRSA